VRLFGKSTLASRILWLQSPEEETLRSSKIRSQLIKAGLWIHCLPMRHEPTPAWQVYDLIFIHSTTPQETVQQIANIRAQHRAPIVLLTDQQAYKWSLATLPAGADAVLPLETPDEVIVARCHALLRRWHSFH
jgi:DNA-binding response OmpR family regulator